MHFMPKLSIGENDLRRVNILSDILPEVYEDDLDAIPALPEVPQPITPATVSRAMADTAAATQGDQLQTAAIGDLEPMPMPPTGPDSSVQAVVPVAVVIELP